MSKGDLTSRWQRGSTARLIRPRREYRTLLPIYREGRRRRRQFTFCAAATLRSIPLAASRGAKNRAAWLDSVTLTPVDEESRNGIALQFLSSGVSRNPRAYRVSDKPDGVGCAIMFLGQARKSTKADILIRTYLRARVLFLFVFKSIEEHWGLYIEILIYVYMSVRLYNDSLRFT